MTAGDHQMMADHGDMAKMHAQMHDGEAMPAECEAMMNDPAMMEQMMTMMHSDEPFSLAKHQEWMNEQNIPADVQAQCLAHMAEHHPTTDEKQ